MHSVSSCKGINRGEGYVFIWGKDTNYVKITISDTEYMHFDYKVGVGEWVSKDGVSPITISSTYCPVRNANRYQIIRYTNGSDVDFIRLYYNKDFSSDNEAESYVLYNPDAKKGIIHIKNELTGNVICAQKIETSYRDNIAFSITSPKWNDFLNHGDATVYQSSDLSFWYSPNLGLGEWNVNGTTIPIRIELLPYGPAIKIYDISNGEDKIILFASGTLSDNNTLILDYMSEDMFYNNSVKSLTLIKTTK